MGTSSVEGSVVVRSLVNCSIMSVSTPMFNPTEPTDFLRMLHIAFLPLRLGRILAHVENLQE